MVRLDSAFGILEALPTQGVPDIGTATSIVLPAETIEVLPATTPEAELRAGFGANVIPCVINRLQLVGHIL